MDRLIAADSVDNAHKPAPPGAGTPEYATDGPPGTVIEAYHYNSIMEEICNVILASGQALDRNNNAQLLFAIRTLGRIRLTGNTNFYVATTGSDANDGRTVGTPWLTRQHAYNVVSQVYDLNGFDANVLLDDGTYTDAFTALGPAVGLNNPGSIEFTSLSGNAAACIINPTAGVCFGAKFGALYSVGNLTVESGAANLFDVTDYSIVQVNAGMIFGATPGAQLFAWNGGAISLAGNYSITGNANYHWDAARLGRIYTPGAITVTLTGVPAFGNAFVNSTSGANVTIDPGITYTGTATGKEYSVTINAVIDTGGGPTPPGNVAGTFATGGQFA